MPFLTVTWPPPGMSRCAICFTRCESGPILLRAGVFSMGAPSSRDLSRFAHTVDQRGAQEESASELRILRLPAQLLVIAAADGRVLFHEQLLVADGLRLGVLHGDVAALAFVKIEQGLVPLAAPDAAEFLGEIERVMNAAVQPHAPDRAVHMRGITREDGAAFAELRRHALMHGVEVRANDVEGLR